MKTKINFYLFLALAALLLTAQFACVKNKPQQAEETAVAQKTEKIKPQELQAQAQQLESLNQKLQARIDSLRQWEAELNSRAARLDSLEKELQARQLELDKAQQSLKNFRATAYLVLFIGIVLIAVAVILLFRSKEDNKGEEVKAGPPTAPKAEETKPAPEAKTETAEEKKPTRAKKKKPTEKEPEKEKTKTAAKSGKNTTGTTRKRTTRTSKKNEEKESEK